MQYVINFLRVKENDAPLPPCTSVILTENVSVYSTQTICSMRRKSSSTSAHRERL